MLIFHIKQLIIVLVISHTNNQKEITKNEILQSNSNKYQNLLEEREEL